MTEIITKNITKKVPKQKGHFLIIDGELDRIIINLKKAIIEECEHRPTFNEIVNGMRRCADENKFGEWLNALNIAHSEKPLSETAKQKIIKILKGGK